MSKLVRIIGFLATRDDGGIDPSSPGPFQVITAAGESITVNGPIKAVRSMSASGDLKAFYVDEDTMISMGFKAKSLGAALSSDSTIFKWDDDGTTITKYTDDGNTVSKSRDDIGDPWPGPGGPGNPNCPTKNFDDWYYGGRL